MVYAETNRSVVSYLYHQSKVCGCLLHGFQIVRTNGVHSGEHKCQILGQPEYGYLRDTIVGFDHIHSNESTIPADICEKHAAIHLVRCHVELFFRWYPNRYDTTVKYNNTFFFFARFVANNSTTIYICFAGRWSILRND